MSVTGARGIAGAGALLAAAGVGIRLHNALVYPLHRGFDADGNWRYVARLMNDWTLPPPDADWATSHPPLFYYMGATIGRVLGSPDVWSNVVAIRLVCSGLGLLAIGLAVWLVRRTDPERPVRALIAGGLLLFLPVHVYMSAMLGEELVVTALTSIAVVAASLGAARPFAERSLGVSAAIGLAAGLAMLTKLTGVLVAVAIVAAFLLDGIRRGEIAAATRHAAVVVFLTALVGGGFYARNLAVHGYIYPKDLAVHSVMFEMPPGERGVVDYVRIPWATFGDPQLVHPDLLHSVWGSTYATLWFDGHRHFLPRDDDAVRRVGGALLLLALLPTVAMAIGVGRGARRLWNGAGTPDGPLLLLVGATLAGYVLFTFRNPWYASVKGSYLLGLSVPFAYYASEVLADWTSRRDLRAALVWGGLVLLGLGVAATFTLDLVFTKVEGPGLDWRSPVAR